MGFYLVRVTRQENIHSRFREGDFILGVESKVNLLLSHSSTWNRRLMSCTEVKPYSVIQSKLPYIHLITSVSLGGFSFNMISKEVFLQVTDNGKLINNEGYYKDY